MTTTNPLSLDFLTQKPAEAAAILQRLPDQQAAAYMTDIPTRILVPVIDCMESWPAARILEQMPTEQNAAIFSRLHYQTVAALLRLQSVSRRDEMFNALPQKLVRTLRQSLVYPEDTVGAWVDSTVPQFAITTTVGECLAVLQKMPQAVGSVLAITNTMHQVAGVVALDQLLIGAPLKPLETLMDSRVQPLDAQMSLSVAREAADWDRYNLLPVRASNGVYIGVITRESLQKAWRLSRPVISTAPGNSLTAHLSRAMVTVVGGLLALLSMDVLTALTGGDKHDIGR